MTTFTKGMIIKMSGLEVKKENGVFEIDNTWEKDCPVYKLKKDGSRIKKGLDIFSYKKIEQYGEIITLDQVSAAITEVNQQLKTRKNNEIIISYVSTDKKEYSNKCFVRVIKSIQTTTSIYAIPTNSIFQLTINEKWGNVTWERIGKKGEVITSGDKSLMSWKNKSMDNLFAEGYLEIVERVETVRKDIEKVNEAPAQIEVTNTNEVFEVVAQVEEVTETKEEVNVEQITENTTEAATYKTGTGNKGNGIEIYFIDKPSEEVRNQLKANGYKWNRNNGAWWTIETPSRLEFAKSICSESTITETVYNNTDAQETSYNYPEVEIDDLESEVYNISQELQDREHDSAWVFRSNKRDHNKEVIGLFTEYQGKVLEVIGTSNNKYYIYKLKQALQRFKKNYHTSYVKYLSQKANNPSWAVTGRSGRNMSQYNKKLSQQDKTMGELVEHSKELERIINKYKSKIRKDKEQATRSHVENMSLDLIFKTERKEFTYMNIKENKQVYTYDNYWICKLWNCWRIFDNGKEINANLKTTDTLETAKKYVAMLVNQQKSA